MVSGQRKTEGPNDEERDFRFWPRVKWTEIQKMIRAVFGSRLLRNGTETLATQAIYDRRTSTESNLITFFGSSGQKFGQIAS